MWGCVHKVVRTNVITTCILEVSISHKTGPSDAPVSKFRCEEHIKCSKLKYHSFYLYNNELAHCLVTPCAWRYKYGCTLAQVMAGWLTVLKIAVTWTTVALSSFKSSDITLMVKSGIPLLLITKISLKIAYIYKTVLKSLRGQRVKPASPCILTFASTHWNWRVVISTTFS